MRILAFVDTHGSDRALKTVIEKSKNADVLVCAGDFTIFEDRMTPFLKTINSLGKPVILIHGNHESASTVLSASISFKNINFIHKTYHIVDDIIFFGYGGGGFTLQDKAFDKVAEQFMKDYETLCKRNNTNYRIIFIAHAPPYGTKLDDLGEHVGNQNLTKFIVAHSPIYGIFGHIHENSGVEDRINNTLIMNPGPNGKLFNV